MDLRQRLNDSKFGKTVNETYLGRKVQELSDYISDSFKSLQLILMGNPTKLYDTINAKLSEYWKRMSVPSDLLLRISTSEEAVERAADIVSRRMGKI